MVAIHVLPVTNRMSRVGISFGDWRRDVKDVSEFTLRELNQICLGLEALRTPMFKVRSVK